jgi:hypothetical protein
MLGPASTSARAIKACFYHYNPLWGIEQFLGNFFSFYTKSEADARATPFMHMTLHVWDIVIMVAISRKPLCNFLEISLSW